MKASSLRRLERLAELPPQEQMKELPRLSIQETDVWAQINVQRISEAASAAMQMLINLGDEPEELAEFRNLCDPSYDIVSEGDAELLKLRDQLRAVWVGEEKTLAILIEWFRRYPLDRDEFEYWFIWDALGTFYPTEKNFRAVLGRICLNNLHLLGRCANPECARFFVKNRRDQKFCLEEDCLRYGNRQRSIKSWRRKHAKPSKKGR